LPGDRPSRSNITEHFDLTPEIRNCFFASIQDRKYLLSDKILLKKFLIGVDRSSRENAGIGVLGLAQRKISSSWRGGTDPKEARREENYLNII
jgi:hypothetical protein